MSADIDLPTLDEIRKWPATVDLVTAARAFRMGRSLAYESARLGTFPVPVLRLGARSLRVVTADLLRVLGGDA